MCSRLILSVCVALLAVTSSSIASAGEFGGMYVGLIGSQNPPSFNDVAILSVQVDRALVTLLPYIEQENFVLTPLGDGGYQFASDGLGTLFLLHSSGRGGALLTGRFQDGTSNTMMYSTAFVRPFTQSGIDWGNAVGMQPALMNTAQGPMFPAGFEIVEGTGGLFTATLYDDNTQSTFNLIGTTSVDCGLMAAGATKDLVIRMTGDVLTDDGGEPTAIEARYVIETAYGKPVANGIIAILIGLVAKP